METVTHKVTAQQTNPQFSYNMDTHTTWLHNIIGIKEAAEWNSEETIFHVTNAFKSQEVFRQEVSNWFKNLQPIGVNTTEWADILSAFQTEFMVSPNQSNQWTTVNRSRNKQNKNNLPQPQKQESFKCNQNEGSLNQKQNIRCMECTECGRSGHLIENCADRKKRLEQRAKRIEKAEKNKMKFSECRKEINPAKPTIQPTQAKN